MSIYLELPRVNEVISLFNSLKVSKAVGHDNFTSIWQKRIVKKLLPNFDINLLFTKVIEKLMYTRLINFFDKHSLIIKSQVFLNGLATVYAVLDVVTNAYENINNNEYTGLVFLDYKKHLTLFVIKRYN